MSLVKGYGFCLANIDFTLVLQKLKVKLNENDFVKFD